jgi:hypothetical protein
MVFQLAKKCNPKVQYHMDKSRHVNEIRDHLHADSRSECERPVLTCRFLENKANGKGAECRVANITMAAGRSGSTAYNVAVQGRDYGRQPVSQRSRSTSALQMLNGS